MVVLKIAEELWVQTYRILNGVFVGVHSIGILFQEYCEPRIPVKSFRREGLSELISAVGSASLISAEAPFLPDLIQTGLEHLHLLLAPLPTPHLALITLRVASHLLVLHELLNK